MLSKINKPAFRRAVWLMAAAVSVLLFSGCAGQKLGPKTVVVKHYPQCYQSIDVLRKRAEEANKSMAATAIFEGLTNAAEAYIRSGGNTSHALKEGGKGALNAIGLGQLVSSEVQSMAPVERFQTYFQAMDRDTTNLKEAVAAAKKASTCYDQQYKLLARNYKAGRISEAEKDERLKEIRAGSNDAMTILRNYSSLASNAVKTYDELLRMERDRPDRAKSTYLSTIGRKKSSYSVQTKSANDLIAVMEKRTLAYDKLEGSITGQGRPVPAAGSGGFCRPCSAS
ncbi:MAG: hypothetical protein LBK52_00310 [Deltaproteobacteria bacterium]|jgi:hypothetical protein|nr:hypothetical protein [Deltaproteobacteria bacterium]